MGQSRECDDSLTANMVGMDEEVGFLRDPFFGRTNLFDRDMWNLMSDFMESPWAGRQRRLHNHYWRPGDAPIAGSGTAESLIPREQQGLSFWHRRPQYDVRNTDDGFVLTALTPGLKKDEINVEVVDGENGKYLEISGGTKKEEKGTEGGTTWHTSTYEHFCNKIRIPEGIHKENIEAKYEEGALHVNVKNPERISGRVEKVPILGQ
mmetsp:Transcript_32075/g.62636  ORF Transcript_32075/g.62636 Transcript_32075/m.62636 type:complete len:207 (+) Transcript_32075:93-713(+)